MGFSLKQALSLPSKMNSLEDVKNDPGRALSFGLGPVAYQAYDVLTKKPETSSNAQDLAGMLPRAEYERYKQVYEPLVSEYESLFTPEAIKANADSAYQRANQSFDTAQTASTQDMARYGVSLTPQQKEAMNRVRRIAKSTSTNKAYNTSLENDRLNKLAGSEFLSGLGRGFGQQAIGLANSAAGLETSRNETNRNLRDQNTAGWVGLGVQGLTSMAGV